MHDVILHHYDASPFSQKAQKMLGLKRLEWQSVEMPMTAPKPDLEALTGGYRGTPVLQYGSDIFVDTVAIAEALDHFFPNTPALLRDASRLASDTMGLWADSLFDPVLKAAVAQYAADWDPHFYADRAAVFPHLDFAALPESLELMEMRIAQLAGQLDKRLEDGRPFIDGEACTLVDIHCWGILWFVGNGLPGASGLMADQEHRSRWQAQMDAIGAGTRVESDYDAARVALSAPPCDPVSLPGGLPRHSHLHSWWDTPVVVTASGADRGTVAGRLVGRGERLTSLALDNNGLGLRHVHFPNAGYDINRG